MRARQIRLGAMSDWEVDEVVMYVQRREEAWEAALEHLVARLERLSFYAAHKAPGDTMPVADGAQVAWELILSRVDTFDPAQGVSFVGYCKRTAAHMVRMATPTYQRGPSIPYRAMARYHAAVSSTDSWDAAIEAAQAKGMSKATFIDAHHAMTGLYALDMDRDGFDDYDGDPVEAAPPDDLLTYEWDNTPDFSVWEAIETLSEKQQEAVLLYARGLSGDDIGRRLGISKRAANYRVEDALNNLRDMYE